MSQKSTDLIVTSWIEAQEKGAMTWPDSSQTKARRNHSTGNMFPLFHSMRITPAIIPKALLMVLLVCSLFAATSSILQAETPATDAPQPAPPSILVPDENGVLWFQKGDDMSTPLVKALRLSQKEPYMVVFVSTTDAYKEEAVAHAQMLAKWFEDNPHTPKKVPVVAYNSSRATFFAFYINGLHYIHKEDAPIGIMGPQESFKLREDAVLTYRARMIIKDRNKQKGETTSFQKNQD